MSEKENTMSERTAALNMCSKRIENTVFAQRVAGSYSLSDT